MLDTIILLTGPAERPTLAAALRSHNSQLTIWPAETLSDLATLEPELLRRARLVAFTTPIVVPAAVLNQLGYGAYNFHPGPPYFPGWAPAHFAIYHRATEFGATVHVMVERVDAGPIVGVNLFRIPVNVGVHQLEAMAYTRLALLFWQNAKLLATQTELLTELPTQWSGQKTTRRHYAELCDIPLDISKEELERRIAVFGGNDFGINPEITLHNIKFQIAIRSPTSPSLSDAVPADIKTQNRAA
jgi:methionyl-tRNA formyltransferase